MIQIDDPKTKMSMTLETIALRFESLETKIDTLEKQMAVLLGEEKPVKLAKKEKKEKKKEKKPKSDEEDKPKVKRISGYILYSKATREEVKDALAEKLGDEDEKVKSTDIMKELGRMWKELSDEDREQWNEKAKELKEAGSDTD